MPVHPNAYRRQYFKYGDIPFGSQHNNLIYGTSTYQSIQKDAPKNNVQDEDNYFVYGTDKNTIASSEKTRFKKLTTGSPAEKKTSKEIMIKAQQAKEARDDYAKFLEKKQNRLIEKEEEKRKDFHLLKSYVAPWLRHEQATKTAGTTRKTFKGPGEDFGPTSTATQSYIRFGEPGCGAPLRNGSGSLKTALKTDPETRFQKRDRHQIHDIIEPLKRQQNVSARNSVNILGQKMKNNYCGERQFETHQPRNILGQTKINWNSNGDDKISQEATDMDNSYDNSAFCYRKSSSEPIAMSFGDFAVKNYHQKENDNHLGHQVEPGNNDKIVNENCESNQFNPWGKAGNGAPNCDSQGNLVAHYQGKWKEDLVGTFNKTKEQKKEDRKYLVNITTQKPPASIREPTVNNGNYYRMHLDAQKNIEAVNSVDQNDVKSFVSHVLNNAMENPRPRITKTKRSGVKGDSRMNELDHLDKDRNTNHTEKQSFEKGRKNVEWKTRPEYAARERRRPDDEPFGFPPHVREVSEIKEGDKSGFSLNPDIPGHVSGFREMETYIPSAQEQIFEKNKHLNESSQGTQQRDANKRPSGSKKNRTDFISEEGHGERDRNEQQESQNITCESPRRSNDSESSEVCESGNFSFVQPTNQNEILKEATNRLPIDPDNQSENHKKPPTLSLSLQRKIKTRRESLIS